MLFYEQVDIDSKRQGRSAYEEVDDLLDDWRDMTREANSYCGSKVLKIIDPSGKYKGPFNGTESDRLKAVELVTSTLSKVKKVVPKMKKALRPMIQKLEKGIESGEFPDEREFLIFKSKGEEQRIRADQLLARMKAFMKVSDSEISLVLSDVTIMWQQFGDLKAKTEGLPKKASEKNSLTVMNLFGSQSLSSQHFRN